jgi:hypothetical protein
MSQVVALIIFVPILRRASPTLATTLAQKTWLMMRQENLCKRSLPLLFLPFPPYSFLLTHLSLSPSSPSPLLLLIQLSQDTVQHYKEQLHLYDLKEIPMFYEFEDSSHIVTGGTTEKAVHTSAPPLSSLCSPLLSLLLSSALLSLLLLSDLSSLIPHLFCSPSFSLPSDQFSKQFTISV